MTDRDALYRAILDNPEDDTLRLVYADALEESGDPQRAAFIRTQIELSHLPEYDPLWVRARCQGHGRTFNPLWTAGLELPQGIDWARAPFRRGLPGAIQVHDGAGAAFVSHADELFLQYPIESLELPTLSIPEARAFAECSWLEHVTSLSLTKGSGRHVIRAMLASPHLLRLTELRVGSELTTPEAVSAILGSWVFKRLTSLGVRSDQRRAGQLAGELARLHQPPRLKKLDLSGNRLTADTLAALVASEAVTAVDDLNLSDNNLGAAGATALARGALPALRALCLLRAGPQAGGVDALVGADFFSELRSLSLAGNPLGPAAAIAVANGPVENLRVLDLHETRVGDRGAAALAQSPRLAGLLELDLAESHIGDAGAEALAGSPHLSGLLYLNLYGNSIEGAAARLRARFGDRVFLPH